MQAVADAAYFLPAYDLRQATLALGGMRERQEAAVAALQPRRKFAFTRKAPAAAEVAAVPDVETAAAAGTDAAAVHAPLEQLRQQHSSMVLGAAGSPGSTLCGLRGQVVAVGREAAAGLEFTLSDLQDCTVLLLAPLAALFLHGLRRCRVLTGPVAGACFVEGGAG